MSKEDEVRQASSRFYSGLSKLLNGSGDTGDIESAWSHDASAMAMHPIDGREVGWEAVKDSFAQFGKVASEGVVELKDQVVHVSGDLAYEVGIESGKFKLAGEPLTINQRVTNVYKLESGQWKMVHHHADLSVPMVDKLKSL